MKKLKSLSRYCFNKNEKIIDLKICFLCEKYSLKENFDVPDISLPDSSGLLGHLKFNSCEFADNLDFQELLKISSLPAAIKTLNNTIPRFFKKLKLNGKCIFNIIYANWKIIVGVAFENIIVPVKYVNGTLVVKCIQPAAAQDFMFVKDDVIKNLNSLLMNNAVKKIKIENK